MGVKATLRDIQSGFLSASSHTANNTLVEEALNKALDRTGNLDNAMEIELDMGNFRVINQADGIEDSDGATMRQLRDAIVDSISSGSVGVAIQNAVDIAVALAIADAGTGFVVQRTENQTGFSSGQTVVTLTTMTYIPGVNNVVVIRNGLTQTTGVDFTEDSTTQITVTPPLVSTDMITVRANDTTTNTVTDSNAVSHTSGASTTSLKDYLDGVDLTLIDLADAANITYTPSDLSGAVQLNDQLDTMKADIASATTDVSTAWLDENGGSGGDDNAMFFTGAIVPFVDNTPKAGWLHCDGRQASRTTYSRLFALIGTTYGVGDGSTTFNTPNMMGYFVRCLNPTPGGADPNRVIGTVQSDELESHSHGNYAIFEQYDGGGSNTTAWGYSATAGTNSNYDTAPTGGTETRPINIAFPYFIKT